MAGFLGSYSGTLDDKHRLHLPARLRQGTEQTLDTCYLTLGFSGALFLFPKPEWRRVETKIENFNFANPEANFVIRILMANTVELSPDRQHRITIPPELASKVGMTKDVKIIGMVRRIELWAPERFDEYVSGYGKTYDAVAAELFGQ